MKENNARTCKLAKSGETPTDPDGTGESDEPSASDNITSNTTSEPSANSFIADIKDAAHQAQNDTGFIYEPTSGLYYDSRTGYYYNAVGLLSALKANSKCQHVASNVFFFDFSIGARPVLRWQQWMLLFVQSS